MTVAFESEAESIVDFAELDALDFGKGLGTDSVLQLLHFLVDFHVELDLELPVLEDPCNKDITSTFGRLRATLKFQLVQPVLLFFLIELLLKVSRFFDVKGLIARIHI